jgi:hypothetical protein
VSFENLSSALANVGGELAKTSDSVALKLRPPKDQTGEGKKDKRGPQAELFGDELTDRLHEDLFVRQPPTANTPSAGVDNKSHEGF